MRQWLLASGGVAVLLGMVTGCRVFGPPDLSPREAADIISRAPEFNRYSRLVKVRSIDHLKDSMDSVSYGDFTFQYLNSPADAPPIEANADFRYLDRKWYLNGFDWGCPSDCHIVWVHDGPRKRD
jgi:hypothetical protein